MALSLWRLVAFPLERLRNRPSPHSNLLHYSQDQGHGVLGFWGLLSLSDFTAQSGFGLDLLLA